MESNTIPDYWNDDSGAGSDGELRHALDSFRDVPPPETGSGFKVVKNCCDLHQIGVKRRLREEACGDFKSKACREKMRRDKLNDRFLELSSVLDPGRPPRVDKTSILSDAARVLAQLKSEAAQLKEANEKLQETIKELKAEKNELRDEKLRLKSEKEKLEQQQQAGFIPPHPIPLHPAAKHPPAIYAAPGKPHAKRAAPYNTFSGVAMWQWLPPAFLDTSQDPKLWPPHA